MIRIALVCLYAMSFFPTFVAASPTNTEVSTSNQAKPQGEPDQRTYTYTLVGMERREYLLGGLTSTVLGFGTGHVVQGRYWKDGWIFTAGEVVSFGAVLASLAPCRDDLFKVERIDIAQRLAKCNKPGLILGQLSFISFRVWETVDAWVTPNPELKEHLFGRRPVRSTIDIGYVPPSDRGSGSLSFAYRF
ncbi:MAG: hypothetical protein FJ146_09250 [Deltaproteobacteria bacterium]|nr:hypothetical protein [Deltaproteobacteria bacterium]